MVTLRVPEETLARRVSLSIPEVCLATGLSEGQVERAIALGRIPCRRVGRRRIVLVRDLLRALENLPVLAPTLAPINGNGGKGETP